VPWCRITLKVRLTRRRDCCAIDKGYCHTSPHNWKIIIKETKQHIWSGITGRVTHHFFKCPGGKGFGADFFHGNDSIEKLSKKPQTPRLKIKSIDIWTNLSLLRIHTDISCSP